jgi:hypothetical protein
MIGLSGRHPWQRRLFAAFWLNACSYPIVFFVLPALIDVDGQRTLYLIVAEIFAPVAECALFYAMFIAPLQEAPTAAPSILPASADPVPREVQPEGIQAPSGVEEGAMKTVQPALTETPLSAGPVSVADRGGRFALWQDMATIVLANLVSFVPLEIIWRTTGWTPDRWLTPSQW